MFILRIYRILGDLRFFLEHRNCWWPSPYLELNMFSENIIFQFNLQVCFSSCCLCISNQGGKLSDKSCPKGSITVKDQETFDVTINIFIIIWFPCVNGYLIQLSFLELLSDIFYSVCSFCHAFDNIVSIIFPGTETYYLCPKIPNMLLLISRLVIFWHIRPLSTIWKHYNSKPVS